VTLPDGWQSSRPLAWGQRQAVSATRSWRLWRQRHPTDLVTESPDGRPLRLIEGKPIKEWL
jgi:hypothetical protein